MNLNLSRKGTDLLLSTLANMDRGMKPGAARIAALKVMQQSGKPMPSNRTRTKAA